MADVPLKPTIAALEGGITSMTPQAGVANIDRWIATLNGNVTLSGIREGLVDLKDALTSTSLDGQRIGKILVALGAQTAAAGSVGDPTVQATVTRMGGLLENAGHLLLRGTPPRSSDAL